MFVGHKSDKPVSRGAVGCRRLLFVLGTWSRGLLTGSGVGGGRGFGYVCSVRRVGGGVTVGVMALLHVI